MWLKVVSLIVLVGIFNLNLSLSEGRTIDLKRNNGFPEYVPGLVNNGDQNYPYKGSKFATNPKLAARVKRGLFGSGSGKGSSSGTGINTQPRPRSNSLPAIPVSRTSSASSSTSLASSTLSKPTLFSSSLSLPSTKPSQALTKPFSTTFSGFQPSSSSSLHSPTPAKFPSTQFSSHSFTSFSPSLPSNTLNRPSTPSFSSSLPSSTLTKPFSSSLPTNTFSKPISTPFSSSLSSGALTKPSSSNPFSSSLPSNTFTKPVNTPFSSSLPSTTVPKSPGSSFSSPIPSNYPFTFTYPTSSTVLSKSPSTSFSSSLPTNTLPNFQNTPFTSSSPINYLSKPLLPSSSSSQTLPTTSVSSPFANTNGASKNQFQPHKQRVFGTDSSSGSSSSSSSNSPSPSNSFRIPSSPQNRAGQATTGLEDHFNRMSINQQPNSQPNSRRESWEMRPVNCAGLTENCYYATAAGLSGQTTTQMVQNTGIMQQKKGTIDDTLDLLKQTNHPNAQSKLFYNSNHMNQYIRDTLPAGTSKAYGVGYYISTPRPLTFNPAIDGPIQGHMVGMKATKSNQNQLNTHAVDFQMRPEDRFPPRNDYVNNGFVHLIDPDPPTDMKSWVNPLDPNKRRPDGDLMNPRNKLPRINENN